MVTPLYKKNWLNFILHTTTVFEMETTANLNMNLIIYQKGDIVKDPMKSIPFLPKIVPGMGWGGSCRGGVVVGWGGSCGVGWVMQG